MAGRRQAVLFAGAEYAAKLAAFPFAVERTERLAGALRQFGYECETHLNFTSQRIRDTVRRSIESTEPGDLLIVHILAHATVDDEGTVLIIGSDGKPGTEDLQDWAMNLQHPDHADVLFLLDLATKGEVVPAHEDEEPSGRALIIAAVTEARAFHGDFSSAAANVFDELTTGTVTASLRNIPVSFVVREIRRWMDDRSAAPARTFATIAGTEPGPPFFPNRRYEPPRPGSAWSIAVNELDGAVTFAAGTDDGVVLCDVDGVPINQVSTIATPAVAHVPGMNAILCGGADGSLTVRSLPGLSALAKLESHSPLVHDIAATAVPGRSLAASAGNDDTVRLWELRPTTRLLHTFRLRTDSAITFIGAEDDPPLLVCGSDAGELVAWDVNTFDEVWRISLDAPIHDLVAGSALGLQVLVSVLANGSLVVVDQETRRILTATSAIGHAPLTAAIADGRTAVAGDSSGHLHLVDLQTADVRLLQVFDASSIHALAMCESTIVAATDDGLRTVPFRPRVEPAPRAHAGFDADVATGVDRLGITGEVNTLCDLVLAKEITPPLSIGLFGDWGTGKSFFMGQMRDRIGLLAAESRTAGLEGRESALCSHVCQIEFNAWHYIDVDLWASLAATIFDQLAAADPATVPRAVLEDLPSVRKVHDDLRARRQEIRDLLDAAGEELKRQSPIGVRDVLTTDTVRQVAGQAANQVDRALEKAGVPKDKVAELDLREVASTAGTLWQNLRFVFQRTKWHLRIVVFLAVLLVVAGPPVIGVLLGDRLDPVATTIASYALFGVTALLAGKPYLRRAKRAVDAAKDLVTSVDERRRAPVEARRETLRQRMVEIDQEILGLDAKIRELRRGTSISAFAVERNGAGNYRRHEGMVATLRRDLEEMSRRLTATNTVGQSADLERIVLYIDDLDRCPPRRVVEVLQAIHLLLAFPLFVVVVGVDSRWLLRSLDMFLRENGGGEDPRTASTPQNYLEKIFQISQCLRPMSPTGYADLISATVGRLEPDPLTQPADGPPAATSEEAVPRPATAPAEAPSAPVRRPAPPPVTGREIRTYRERGEVLHLRFDSATTLESVDTTGDLTRRWMLGADPREERVTLVDEPITCAIPLSGGRLLVVGASGAVLAGDEAETVKAGNGRVIRAVGSAQSGRVALETKSGWYVSDLTNETKLPSTSAVLALSRSWTVERDNAGPVVARNGNTEVTVEVSGSPVTAGVDPSERWLAVRDTSSGLRLRDLTKPDAPEITLGRNARFLEFGPHNLIATSSGYTVLIWDCESRTVRAEVPAEGEISAVAFSPDGRRLATGNSDGRVRTWVVHNRMPAVDLSAGALRLTRAEHAMIIAVRPFIETPRSAKRLVNTYRLLRAALTESDLAALRDNGHKPVLLLLSVLLGEPEEATEFMRDLLGDRPLPPAFTSLIRRRGITAPPAGLEAKIAEIITATGITNDTADYRRWAGVVARYSFRTLDL
jgi:WD40 repeat protein